jgi:hypothetical protein
VVSLRRKPSAQVLAFGAGRDAGRPERPGIEDEACADVGPDTEFCRSGPRRWHIGDRDFFFTPQQISSDILSRVAINSLLRSVVFELPAMSWRETQIARTGRGNARRPV